MARLVDPSGGVTLELSECAPDASLPCTVRQPK